MLTDNQEQMVFWIKERDHIRELKESGIPTPWTNYPVMQETYFCNVNREDDKVTKWIRENWLWGLDTDYYDFAMIVARIFNLPTTLADIGQPMYEVEPDDWFTWAEEILTLKKDVGKKIWNGAYIISTNGKKIDKLTYCMQILRKACKPNITKECLSLEEAHKELMKIEGLASFLAAQVVADLKNSIGHHLHEAHDWWTFSAPGPGSLRGLEWFFEEKVTARNYHRKIKKAYDILEWELPDNILDILCMQNLQNCFCEYDKFMRVSTGTGRSKRKYKAGGNLI